MNRPPIWEWLCLAILLLATTGCASSQQVVSSLPVFQGGSEIPHGSLPDRDDIGTAVWRSR